MFDFTIDGQSEGRFTQSEMLEANRDDADLCAFLIEAEVGAKWTDGGGAAPILCVERVA